MKDIDFDELDKAVNSLMGNIKDQSDQPAPKTLTISTTLKENEAPEYTKLEQVAQKIGSETIGGPTERTAILPETRGEDPLKTIDLSTSVAPEAPTLPAPAPTPSSAPASQPEPTPMPVAVPSPVPERGRSTVTPHRSSGRFMDVMHHSSDMRTATSSEVPPSAAPSREARTIAPPVRSTDQDSPSPDTSPVAVPPSVIEPVAVAEPEKVELPKSEPVAEPAEPLSSPFLPDAKVEKRPLGGPAVEASDIGESATQDERDKDTQLTPDASQAAEELPAELHNDLLAIETNIALESPSADIPDDSTETKPAINDSVNSQATSLEDAAAPVGPASIPQQYNELPNSGDQSNGAIFDVDDYHKQPVHPTKSHRSWLWIILIIVIIVISAAGGAAFYLLSAK